MGRRRKRSAPNSSAFRTQVVKADQRKQQEDRELAENNCTGHPQITKPEHPLEGKDQRLSTFTHVKANTVLHT